MRSPRVRIAAVLAAIVIAAMNVSGCRKPEAPAPRSTSQVPAAARAVLTAEVLKNSKLPDPSRAPYPDCLTVLKVRAGAIESGGPLPDEFLVAAWGFRDRVLQAPAGFAVGDRLRLELKPFRDVSPEIERIQQVDDVREFQLPLYWAVSAEKIPQGEPAASRAASMKADIDRIEAELKHHGGDWERWHQSLEPLRRDLAARAESGHGIVVQGSRCLASPESLAYRLGPAAFTPEPAVRMLVRLRDELKKRGADLIVLPMPSKELALAPFLSASAPADRIVAPYYEAVYLDLLEHDIETVDVLPEWIRAVEEGETVFHAAPDVHPADVGVRIAARALARRLARYGFPPEAPPGGFATRKVSFTVPKGATGFPPGYQAEATQVLGADGSPIETPHDSPILIIGDCFVLVPEELGVAGASLPSQLAKEIGVRPTILAESGGAARIMVKLSRKGAGFLRHRRVVVFVGYADYFFVPWEGDPGGARDWVVIDLPEN